jgi:hypothetical protein
MANAKSIPEEKHDKPIRKLRCGNVTATVWKNTFQDKKTGRSYESESVQFAKIYKDKDGKWQTTSSYNKNEVSRLLGVALRYLSDSVTSDDSEPTDESEQ